MRKPDRKRTALAIVSACVLIGIGGLVGCEAYVRRKEASYASILREVAREIVLEKMSQKEAIVHIKKRLGDRGVEIGSELTAVNESDYWKEEMPDLMKHIEHLAFGFDLPQGTQFMWPRYVFATVRFRDGVPISWNVGGTGASDYDAPEYSGTE